MVENENKTVGIEAKCKNVSICSHNSHWFDRIWIGVDLGIRVTFAYLMKHNLLNIKKFIDGEYKRKSHI